MYYIVDTPKTFAQAATDLEAAVVGAGDLIVVLAPVNRA